MEAGVVTKGAIRVGIDSGGTFTDVCVLDVESGTININKLPSTPAEPSDAIVAGAEEAIRRGGGSRIAYFGHGTTVATNALIERKGERSALITTLGFRDVLEIARQKRPALYDLLAVKPKPLVSRDLRLEVRERIMADGSVSVPLDEEDVRRAARHLRKAGVTTVAVSLLFAFLNPAHELRVAEIFAEEYPEALLSLSHLIAPEFREYERTSTTVVNAYLQPVMNRYIGRLEKRLAELGLEQPVLLTQSSGGLISADQARREPVRTVLSGPAAGLVGAAALASQAGYPDIITFDMGGTSSDVALVRGGRPVVSSELSIEGYPLKVPSLEIHTVGAGGGSIARIDAGRLKVGPESAGADPGPVCYGRGNLEPTVTDANVVLGTLDREHLLAGALPIDAGAAHAAVTRLGESLSLSPADVAEGILRIVSSNMEKAIRLISVARGYDPRDFTLVAFGGAGPLHAARLARDLNIPRVLVPRYPGVLCAMGLLLSDIMTTFTLTHFAEATLAAMPSFLAAAERLVALSEDWFDGQGIAPGDRATKLFADARYRGQGHELTVELPFEMEPSRLLETLRTQFEAAHERAFRYRISGAPIQTTALRIEATAHIRKARMEEAPPAQQPVAAARSGSRQVYSAAERGWRDVPLYDRARLGPGHAIEGPAIVEQFDATIVILADQSARVDGYLNIIIESTG